jgi:uncharacterized membrane protein
MPFNTTDWKNLIWTPVILLVTAAFQFYRHHPETACLFVGAAFIILIIIFIQLRKK